MAYSSFSNYHSTPNEFQQCINSSSVPSAYYLMSSSPVSFSSASATVQHSLASSFSSPSSFSSSSSYVPGQDTHFAAYGGGLNASNVDLQKQNCILSASFFQSAAGDASSGAPQTKVPLSSTFTSASSCSSSSFDIQSSTSPTSVPTSLARSAPHSSVNSSSSYGNITGHLSYFDIKSPFICDMKFDTSIPPLPISPKLISYSLPRYHFCKFSPAIFDIFPKPPLFLSEFNASEVDLIETDTFTSINNDSNDETGQNSNLRNSYVNTYITKLDTNVETRKKTEMNADGNENEKKKKNTSATHPSSSLAVLQLEEDVKLLNLCLEEFEGDKILTPPLLQFYDRTGSWVERTGNAHEGMLKDLNVSSSPAGTRTAIQDSGLVDEKNRNVAEAKNAFAIVSGHNYKDAADKRNAQSLLLDDTNAIEGDNAEEDGTYKGAGGGVDKETKFKEDLKTITNSFNFKNFKHPRKPHLQPKTVTQLVPSEPLWGNEYIYCAAEYVESTREKTPSLLRLLELNKTNAKYAWYKQFSGNANEAKNQNTETKKSISFDPNMSGVYTFVREYACQLSSMPTSRNGESFLLIKPKTEDCASRNESGKNKTDVKETKVTKCENVIAEICPLSGQRIIFQKIGASQKRKNIQLFIRDFNAQESQKRKLARIDISGADKIEHKSLRIRKKNAENEELIFESSITSEDENEPLAESLKEKKKEEKVKEKEIIKKNQRTLSSSESSSEEEDEEIEDE